MWYVSALVYVGLAVALLMIKVDFMSKKIEDKDVEIEKYNKRIEEIIKSSPFPIIISRLSDDKLILANNNAVKLFGIQPSELDRYRLRDFLPTPKTAVCSMNGWNRKKKCRTLKFWSRLLPVIRLSGC